MMVKVRSELRIAYPRVVFGSLVVKNAANIRQHDGLDERKRVLEKEIRDNYPDPCNDSVMQSYSENFKKWGKTYPLEFQVKSIKKGKSLPNVSALVDCMFMAELRNRVLTSGHDLDTVRGELVFDVSNGGEEYMKLNGENQMLPKGDVILRDSEGILASVLYGPARRTSISHDTCNALYFAWCPNGMGDSAIHTHLADIEGYLDIVYGDVDTEVQLHK